MILTPGKYLPMFMNQAVLAPVFQAAANDTQAEVQALDKLRVAAGKGAAPQADLIAENAALARTFADYLTINLMDSLKKNGAGDDQDSADVVEALELEAASQTKAYENLMISGQNLTDEQILKNTQIRRDQAVYKALCLRLAEAMPK